ncbi:condensation domain-containing protein, partial [Parafrankia sp. FMc6]|uniref:condensation domain-containing protein n=1 Tax=Parafrankia soli TaxID=2599596 RepID=UPI0034D67174
MAARGGGAGGGVASFAQQRMWFLDQLDPGSGVYNVAAAWRLRGRLDVDALEAALNALIERHEVLRTGFHAEDGVPTPVVHDHVDLPLTLVDVSTAAEPGTRAAAVLRDAAEQPLDLQAGPFVRTLLVTVAEREHLLAMTLHHISVDGWSLDVLLRELAELYAAFREGRPSPLPDLPIQYSDYARWQRELLTGDVLARHVGYWERALDGAPLTLDLPADRARPPVPSYRGGVVTFACGAELGERLRELSLRLGVTVFMTTAAAFAALLHRLTGQDDLCLGYSVANRDRVETEGVVGVFVNTLVLRARTDPAQTFEQAVTAVRDRMLDADAHRDLPFEKLVEELRPPRDPRRHPVFQVTFGYGTTYGSRPSTPGPGQCGTAFPDLEVSPVEPEYQTAKFDLSLFLSDTGAGTGLAGDAEFSSDLFERETIERFARQYVAVLEAVVTDPRMLVTDLPVTEPARPRPVAESPAPEEPAAGAGEASGRVVARTPTEVVVA